MPDDIDPQASVDPFPLRRAQEQANGASFHVIGLCCKNGGGRWCLCFKN